jgi:integrase
VLHGWPGNNPTFLTTLRGKPFEGHVFTQWLIKACERAGLSRDYTFHGLRKAACRRLAEAGCTVHEIASISGHVSLKEIERYTKAAHQQRFAHGRRRHGRNRAWPDEPVKQK